MFRALLIILLVLIALRIFKNVRKSFKMHSRVQAGNRVPSTTKELVACNRCGMYVVKSSALNTSGHYYCSDACMKG